MNNNQSSGPTRPGSSGTRKSKSALTAGWSLVAFLVCLLTGIIGLNAFPVLTPVFAVIILVGVVWLPVAVVAGLIAVINIEESRTRIKGETRAYLVILVGGFFLYLLFAMPSMGNQRGYAQKLVCRTNLKGLGNALTVYAHDYGTFPTADEWCDLLVQCVDVSPRSFVCPQSEDEEGECSYALNKFIIGKENTAAKNVVLAFETTLGEENGRRTHAVSQRPSFGKYSLMQDIFSGEEKVKLHRWNQVGGPQDLNVSAHKIYRDGCNILFADGYVEWCNIDDLPNLKWDPDDDSIRWDESMMTEEVEAGMPVEIKNRNLMILGAVLAVLSIIGWLMLPGVKMKVFGFCAAVVAAGMGAFWALVTENFYFPHDEARVIRIGWQTGIAWGVFTAVWYCLWICRAYKAGRTVTWGSDKRRVQYDLLWGMGAGVFCSMAVHITLGLYHNPYSWEGIIHGPYFGLLTGLLTAAIIRMIFSERFMDKPAPPPIPAKLKGNS